MYNLKLVQSSYAIFQTSYKKIQFQKFTDFEIFELFIIHGFYTTL